MSNVATVDDAGFDTAVANGVVLVDLWAPWCGPCRLIAPVVEEIAVDMSGLLSVVKADVDAATVTASKLGIRSIPCLLLYKDGIEIGRIFGAQPKAKIVDWIKDTAKI